MSNFSKMYLIPQDTYDSFVSKGDKSAVSYTRQFNQFDVQDGGKVVVRNDDNVKIQNKTITQPQPQSSDEDDDDDQTTKPQNVSPDLTTSQEISDATSNNLNPFSDVISDLQNVNRKQSQTESTQTLFPNNQKNQGIQATKSTSEQLSQTMTNPSQSVQTQSVNLNSTGSQISPSTHEKSVQSMQETKNQEIQACIPNSNNSIGNQTTPVQNPQALNNSTQTISPPSISSISTQTIPPRPPYFTPRIPNPVIVNPSPRLVNPFPSQSIPPSSNLSHAPMTDQSDQSVPIEMEVGNLSQSQELEASESESGNSIPNFILQVSTPEKGIVGQINLEKNDISYTPISSDDDEMGDQIIDVTNESESIKTDQDLKDIFDKKKKKKKKNTYLSAIPSRRSKRLSPVWKMVSDKLPHTNILKSLTEQLSPSDLDQIMLNVNHDQINPVVNISFNDKKEADDFLEDVSRARNDPKMSRDVKKIQKKSAKELNILRKEKRINLLKNRRQQTTDDEKDQSTAKINLRKRRAEKEPTVSFSKQKEPEIKKKAIVDDFDSDDYDIYF